jgi:hypothetical protein
MNKKQPPVHLALLRSAAWVLAGVAVAACAPMPPGADPAAKARPCKLSGNAVQPLQLKYANNTNTTIVFADKKLCPSNPPNQRPNPPNANGNVCTERNKKPNLSFVLTGQLKDDYEFVDVPLGGASRTGGDLPPGVFYDFDFASLSDFEDGKPQVTFPSQNKHTMRLENNNCFAFEIHYWVTLKHKQTGDEIDVHPIIVNRGSDPY